MYALAHTHMYTYTYAYIYIYIYIYIHKYKYIPGAGRVGGKGKQISVSGYVVYCGASAGRIWTY